MYVYTGSVVSDLQPHGDTWACGEIGSGFRRVAFYATAGTTYRIAVYSYADFVLKLEPVVGPAPVTPPADEPNNSKATATPILPGQTITAGLGTVDDVDYYKYWVYGGAGEDPTRPVDHTFVNNLAPDAQYPAYPAYEILEVNEEASSGYRIQSTTKLTRNGWGIMYLAIQSTRPCAICIAPRRSISRIRTVIAGPTIRISPTA